MHSLEHLQLWAIQPPGPGSSTLPLTLSPVALFRSLLGVQQHPQPAHSLPGAFSPFAVTAKHISRYSQMSKGRLARGKITSGSEPLCQTHSANPNTGNFPFTDLTHYSGRAASSGSRNHANQHKDMGEQKCGEQSGLSACGN